MKMDLRNVSRDDKTRKVTLPVVDISHTAEAQP